jgi:hypothetical protein
MIHIKHRTGIGAFWDIDISRMGIVYKNMRSGQM